MLETFDMSSKNEALRSIILATALHSARRQLGLAVSERETRSRASTRRWVLCFDVQLWLHISAYSETFVLLLAPCSFAHSSKSLYLLKFLIAKTLTTT